MDGVVQRRDFIIKMRKGWGLKMLLGHLWRHVTRKLEFVGELETPLMC